MPDKSRQISFGCTKGGLFIRFDSEGTRDTCRVADELVNNFLGTHTDSPTVMFDLRKCGWVDSTFAGWMVGLNKRLKEADGDGALRVVGWSDGCRESLERMSLCRLFEQGPADEPRHFRVLEYPRGEAADRSAIELMAQAHRELAEMDDENRRIFGPIADMLEQQLGRIPS
ncbi:MAG: hypothetical protein IID33_01105 [Planctomycetes bacterium]|nr:hypothetical protein [Planctomycetota bacterium]